MHTKHKTIILLFSIIVSMAGAAPIARIMKSEGNVLIKRMGKSTFTIPSKPGLGINNGDAIKVGEEGFAVAIFIDDKSVIKIREKTQFEFIESASSRTLDIEQGTMFFDIKKEGRTKTFRVETPVSVASVKGTEFAVISSPAGIDQVFCASGQLDVQNLISGQSVVVGPGQKAISNAMGNVMELPFTPDDYPADPEGVQPELKTEQKPESEPEQPQQQQRQESSVQETQEEQDEEPETEEDQEQEQMESDDTPSQSQPSKPEPKKPFGMGLGVGSVTIDGILYNQIALRPEINIGKIGIGLDLVFYIDNKGNIKEDEWDFKNDPSRIFDKILFLRWGEESDPFWVKFGSLDNVTLGYGGILSGYSNMMEFPEVRRIGLNTGVNIAGIGGQLFMSNMKDFSRGGTILGLRGTYKVSDSFPLTVGLNFVTDMNQFSGLKDIDEDSYPDIFDDFPNDANYYNDTDGDGVPDPHPGVKVPEEGWDIDADGDNIYDENEDAADLVLKGVPFSIADNKSSVTGFAFDIGYPLLKGKVFSLDLYTEFNFLNFPEVGAPDSLFYRPNYSGKSFSVPGLRASLFNFLKLSYEFRIKDGYFVPQFFDQSYDLTRVVPEYIDGSAIVKTKDMTLFADSSMNVGLGGHFGSISADVFGFGSLYGSYTNMTSETDTVNSFVAALTLNAERIPKLSEATAFYQRTNDSNPFDFENPSVNTVMGYRLGYELGKGISVIWDYRQFYRFTGALNDDGTGKLEPVVQTTIETSFNF